jgi:hypothetical protein
MDSISKDHIGQTTAAEEPHFGQTVLSGSINASHADMRRFWILLLAFGLLLGMSYAME